MLQVRFTQEVGFLAQGPGATQLIEVSDIWNKQLARSERIVSREDWMDQNDPAERPCWQYSATLLRPGSKLASGAFVFNAKAGAEANKPNLQTQVVLFHDAKVLYTGKRNSTPSAPSTTR